MAELLAASSKLWMKEKLQEFCDILQIDYIMLFDSKGKEMICNKEYSNFSLGTGQGENGSDFCRLLQGVPYIVHDASVDPTTGLERQIIGITMPETSNVDPHGALIMALLPDRTSRTSQESSINKQFQYMADIGEIYLGANDSNGEILYSSDEDLLGMSVQNFGLEANSLKDRYMGFASIQGNGYTEACI